MSHRGFRIRAAVAAAAAAGLLLAGCGSPEGGDHPAPQSPLTGAQSDLAPPVSAVTDEENAPASVTIDGATAPTDPVATDATGALLPPQDVDRLGWWVDSALPGSGAGTVVISGHVNEVEQGDGFAARFLQAETNQTVTVQTVGGTAVDYRVTSIQHADKNSEFPAERLNRLGGAEELALITCGGEFVGPPLGYADNVIVWAEPA